MQKNYFVKGLTVLSSVLLLNACQHYHQSYSGQPFEHSPIPEKKALAPQPVSQASTEKKQNFPYGDLFGFGETESQINLRREFLASLSKPGENLEKDLADRRLRKLQNRRLPNEKSGIEEIAEYRRKITMPIGTDKILYEDGFLIREYNKAIASPVLARAQKANFDTALSGSYSLANITWKERGPNNVPGRDRSIVPSPANPDKWYVGTAGGGIWQTSDAGVTWKNTTDLAIPSLATSSLGISQKNPDVIYAGSGEPFGNLDALTGAGMMKSTDAGNTWKQLPNTTSFGSVGRIAVNPANENHVVVGTAKGIFVSTDGGATWNNTFKDNTLSNVQDIKATNDFSVIYASVNKSGVLKSTDGGNNWTKVFDVAASGKAIKRIELAVAPTDNNRLFLGCEAGSTVAFFISDDAGAAFTEIAYKSGDSKEIYGDQGWYDNAVAISPVDKNTIYVGGVYLAKLTINPAENTYNVLSIASGYDTKKLNTYVHPDQHGIVCQLNPDNASQYRILLTNDGGVYYTPYSAAPGEIQKDWRGPVKGLNTTQFYGADKKKGEDAYLAGAQDNGSQATITAPSSAASTYLGMLGGDGFEVIWNYNDTNKLLFGSQYNNFIISVNGVQTAKRYYATNADAGATYSPFYSKLANANNNPDAVFTVSSKGVWRTTDFGTTWSLTPFTDATNGKWLGNSSSATVKVSVANPNVVWAASAVSGGTGTTYKVNLSKDNGMTFAKTTGTFPTTASYYISGLSASYTDPARAYVIFSAAGQPKIVRTNDYGNTWTDITAFSGGVSTAGFPDVPVHSVLEMPFDKNVIWAGTDIGIFETTDGGASWYIIPNIPPVSVWSMKIVDDQVVLATHGRGVWTATVPELSSYTMPEYIGPPSTKSLQQAGIHDMQAKAVFNYSNPKITALKVFVDNNYVSTISGTTANTDYNFTSSTLKEGTHTVSVSGLYDNGASETIKDTRPVEIISFNAGAANVNLPTFTASDVYIGNGKFVIDNVAGKFSANVLNNVGHPYANSTVYQTYLRTPIVVGNTSKMALTHMALTEAGYDYAIVEASKDLVNWTPVATYDESTFANWTNVAAADVSESLFQKSGIDLTSKFPAGTEVAVRLRLSSDEAETKYGWVVKSLMPDSSLAAEDVKVNDNQITISPNPAGETTGLYLPDTIKGNVKIGIYDASGKMVETFTKPASSVITLNTAGLNKGVYLILVKTETVNKALKLMKK